MADDIDLTVRELISFFKFGNMRHAHELTDEVLIADLSLSDEDALALAYALTRFARQSNPHAKIDTQQLTQNDVTVGEVIVVFKAEIAAAGHAYT